MNDTWEYLLETAKKVHLANSKLQDFCPFPKDIKRQKLNPFHIPASDLMQNETGLLTDDYAELRDAFILASPYAHWRQTYKGTIIGEKFLNKFGCYGLIGPESPFKAKKSAHGSCICQRIFITLGIIIQPKRCIFVWLGKRFFGGKIILILDLLRVA